MATLTPPLTVEDYKLLPESGPNYQLIDGVLHMSPSPTRFHQHISLNLGSIVRLWIKSRHGNGSIYAAPLDVYLDNTNVFQPDLIYVSEENQHVLTDAGIEGAPDLVVEILSPSTRNIDLGVKKGTFAKHGVKEFWSIDPASRELSVFDLQEDPDNAARTLEETDILKSDQLPGLEIHLAEAFGD